MTPSIHRAVWSFWTKPYRTRRQQGWYTDKHHWLASWVLSVETARQHYPETVLVTDDEGARILIDSIGLKFTSVSLELNQL